MAAKLNASNRLPSLLRRDNSHYRSHANFPLRIQRDWLSRALKIRKIKFLLGTQNCPFEDLADLCCKIASLLSTVALVGVLHESEVDNEPYFAL